MPGRVHQLRARLAPLLTVASDAVRADIEELLVLAEIGERAPTSRPDTPQAATPQSVAMQSSAAESATAATEPLVVPLRETLVAVLSASAGPMRVRDLAEAALARGWTTSSASPRNVVAACLNARPEFVAVGRGEYVLRDAPTVAPGVVPERDGSSETPPESAPPASRVATVASTSEAPSLRDRLREILAESRAPMAIGDLVDALRVRGWSTTSPRPRDVVSAVLTSKPEFVATARGVYALRVAAPVVSPSIVEQERDALDGPKPTPSTSAAEVARASADASEPPPAVLAPAAPVLAPGVLRRVALAEQSPAPGATSVQPAPARPAVDVADVRAELEFLLQLVADARADTAVLAPSLLRLQITAWIARARALNDRARANAEITRATGRVAAELGELCKRWWPGSVEAMRLDTTPQSALAPFAPEEATKPVSWAVVADRLDAMMAAAWAEPGFDDGWKDSRWLCRDERYVAERVREAEELLARVGTPIEERPTGRAADLKLEAAHTAHLLRAARGLRWVRGLATDGLRWGALMGRLRWMAATHPVLARSGLPQVLAESYEPLGSGWGFDNVVRQSAKDALLAQLPQVPPGDIAAWLTKAIDVFDNPELARVLAPRRSDVASIDAAALTSRRLRGRLRKLASMMDIAVPEAAAMSDVAASMSTAEIEATEPAPEADGFASLRAALLDRIGGNRALFISNREDVVLRDKLSATFGLDLEWCVAHPRRVDAATESIRRGRYQVILSATGFQDHTMDAAFARAAKDATTLYVRVNRGRPAACARAIARELGLERTS